MSCFCFIKRNQKPNFKQKWKRPIIKRSKNKFTKKKLENAFFGFFFTFFNMHTGNDVSFTREPLFHSPLSHFFGDVNECGYQTILFLFSIFFSKQLKKMTANALEMNGSNKVENKCHISVNFSFKRSSNFCFFI